MLQILLLKIGAILLLLAADECLQISDNAESELIKLLTNVESQDSKSLPFIYKQQSSQSSDDSLTSSSVFESVAPNSSPYKSSVFSKGQESSLYLKKSPLLSLISSYLNSAENVPSSKLSESDLVQSEGSLEYDETELCKSKITTKLTLCELKKQLLKEIQPTTDDLKDEKFLVQILSTNYKNPDQSLSSRTKPKKKKINMKVKSNEASQLAENWYGSQKSKKVSKIRSRN